MINPSLLNALLADDVTSLADGAAGILLRTPSSYTPRVNPVTYESLANSAVWGFAKTAAFRAALTTTAAASNAEAALLHDLLKGSGFLPSDPQTSDLVPLFAEIGNVSDDDAKLAIGMPVYRAGYSPTDAEVTENRAALTSYQAIAALRSRVQGASIALDHFYSLLLDGSSITLPAWADLASAEG